MPEAVPSEELRAFMQRFYAAWQGWDFEALSDMISTQPHSLVVGTDRGTFTFGASRVVGLKGRVGDFEVRPVVS